MSSYPTDAYRLMQYNMTNGHNVYKVGYQRIIALLDNPPHDDLDNFLGYVRAWASHIVGHHDSEELCLFPFLSKKLDLSKESEQHAAVHHGLAELINYIDQSRAQPSLFSAAKLKSLIEELAGPFFEHCDYEVANLAPEKGVRPGGAHKYVTLPFLRCHTPPELKEVWPPLPWFVKRVVVPWMLAPKNAGYWKYAPYEMQ